MMRDMVVPWHLPRLAKLIHNEEKKMGLIPSNLDDLFNDAEAPKAPEGGGGLLPAGKYEGVIVGVAVTGESRKPWVTAELQLKITVDEGEFAGKSTFCDIELAPNTDKTGQPSKGKLGFVKGQLSALGYTGKLSDVEFNAQQFMGARVGFTQKVDDGYDEQGNLKPYARINTNTNKPYVNREVYLNELLSPGIAAPAVASSEPAIY